MRKTFFALTLVCIIFIAQFFGVALPSAYAEDLTGTIDTDSPTIYNFITGLEITQTGPDNSLPPALGSDVPQNGEFRMTYSFNIPQYVPDPTNPSRSLTDEDFFFLYLPDYVHVPSNVTNINIVDSTYGIHVLDVSMLMPSHADNPTGQDVIRVDFTSQLEASTGTFAFSGEFWFEASFDADEVDAGGPITINFDSGRTSAPYAINVDFIEDPPVDPTLVKSNSRTWNATEHRHYITWTVDLNQEDVDLGAGAAIIDPLPLSNTELEYIGNVTQTRGSAAYTASYDNATHTFRIDFNEAVTERQTFTFQTAFFDTIYIDHLNNNDNRIEMSNQARAETVAGTIYSNINNRNTGIDVINKFDTSIDTVNRRITWRIEANPNNYIVNNAFVTDSIPAGLTVDDSTISYEFQTSGTVYSATDTPFDATINYSSSGQDYQFNLGNITEEVWIVFETIIDDDEYYDQANVTYRNDAYFHPPAAESWRSRGRHDVPISTDVLQKSSPSIDIANGIITWQLRINPNTNATNPVQLADLVVTDPIPDNITTSPASANNGLSFIPGTITVNRAIDGEVAGATATYDSANNQIVVDFDPDDVQDGVDVIELEYIITYQTQIVDDYIYKVNDDSSVTNTASYTSFNAGTGSDSATRNIQPDVLQKAFVSYNYDTHRFRWHINVNSIQTELEYALITDYISEDMVYVPSSFEIFDSSASPYTGGVFTYTEHDPAIVNPETGTDNISGTLEYQFPATITDSYDIYFETEYVDFDQLADNHLDLSTDYLEASNTVYFVHDDLPSGDIIFISDSERFTSSVVEKAPEYSSGEQYIDWVLTINKNQIEILGPSPVADPDTVIDGPVIYDTLQEGLVIDLESIKLYNAVVNADNSITVDRSSGSTDEVTYDRAAQVTYDGNTRQLTFSFEDTINTCYVMTFRTYIESGYSGVNFSNTASFYALAGDETDTSSDESVLFATGGGYAAANIGHLLLRKVDAESGDPLQGATFELVDSSGTVVDAKVTDVNGEALFEFVFFDRQYYYRESAAPYGYSGDTTTLVPFIIETATATDEGPADPDRTHTPAPIPNTANLVTIEFTKYAEDQTTPLAGATFAIYDQSAPTVELTRVISDVNGLVSFENMNANRSYNIIEVMPPMGYVIYPHILTVDVTVGGPFSPAPPSGHSVIYNTKDATAVNNVTFTKYAEDGLTPLAGCTFGIYSASEPNTLRGTAESQIDGSVTFTNAAPGDYIIRELSSVSGYQVSSTELTVTVDVIPGTYVTTPSSLSNDLIGSVEVEVHSTFSLSGMSFRIGLYRESDGAFIRELEYVNGSLSNFNNLPFETYTAVIMPNSHGLAGASQEGTITITETHAHVDIYLTRNPRTGDDSRPLMHLVTLALLLVLALLGSVYHYYRRSRV